MKVSIVITTKNRINDLSECIKSISSSTFKDIELVIIDDNSSDGTEKLNASEVIVQPCKIIHSKENLMMVKARNIGAQEAKGDYLLFIDDDNIIDTKMIELLVNTLNENESYGFIGPSMYYLDSRDKYMDYQTVNLYTGHTKGCIDPSILKLCDSDGVPNVFMIRKVVFEKCGYFDEQLLQTFTEPEYAFKINGYGYKTGMVKDAITYHKVSKKQNMTPRFLGGQFKQKAYCLMRNRTVLVARYGNILQKTVYISLFSWLWPLVYSIIMLPRRRYDLIKLYYYGWVDGLYYFVSGNIKLPLPVFYEKTEK